MSIIKKIWLEAIEDNMYRIPPQRVFSLNRVIDDLIITVPAEGWGDNFGLTLTELGYKHQKASQWEKFYMPLSEEWDLFGERVSSLSKKKGPFLANLAIPLRGRKTKEGSVAGTKGHCLLEAVVGISRNSVRAPVRCRVWIFSRTSEIFTKFGADLCLINQLLLPKLLEKPREIFPNLDFKGVTFYLCSSYLIAFRLMGLVIFDINPMEILRRGAEACGKDKGERTYIRRVLGSILIAVDNPEQPTYQAARRTMKFYRESWIPHRDEVEKLLKEVDTYAI